MAGEFHLHVERAMTHILYNLDRSLTLAEVGAVSPFYFHRIFSAVAGACPNQASPRSVADVRGSFTRGLAILLCLLVVLQLAALPLDAESTSTLRSLVLRYFALGLLVTALAHRGSLHGSLGIAAPVSLSWMVATLLRTWTAGLCFKALHWLGQQLSSTSDALPPLSKGGPSEPPSSSEAGRMGSPLRVSQADVLPYMLVVIGLLAVWLFIGLLLRGRRGDEPLAREQASSLLVVGPARPTAA